MLVITDLPVQHSRCNHTQKGLGKRAIVNLVCQDSITSAIASARQ